MIPQAKKSSVLLFFNQSSVMTSIDSPGASVTMCCDPETLIPEGSFHKRSVLLSQFIFHSSPIDHEEIKTRASHGH